ncbi:flavin monoamine oxidase family protein [Rhizobium bangladeshense]|uniref:flavin monoamine oxidase family protein n=1 Tax=Rhizobium bangladeshense TaxID=1138189 RepID=UPI001C839B3A|nr:NAD(P)/FAD-dependent oxidoreductase [Rhizobium bangladeshense]MBX4868377.1 NAD(P)-binding protein [Rhizobium bangladeshense]MBX4903295.1 NAD(P)-binding protein [Rhizobium bangladeshense]MBX4915013.1 NAD(P)-binding protein [Rhizobium bangladeshense]MBX4920087.1 NAD(P)-binding protein [Rhizobium bangladeshense]MBY3597658.1 FAD-dependent oxidoreductase [Rhizobium bangladeshense]
MPADTNKNADQDVVIIGAGAAGIAAGRRLQAIRPDLSILLLEAGDRLGGRAWTVGLPGGGDVGLDLGCGWLHGARTNAWTEIASEVGLTVDRSPAPWNGGRQLQRDAEDVHDAQEAISAYFERLESHEGKDTDLAAKLEPGNRWNGQIRAIGTYITGAELERSSIVDYNRYDPGPGPDWRVREGYGALLSLFGRPVPARLGIEVRRIDHRHAGYIGIATDRGVLRARAVLLTVSTNVLAAGSIAFDPPLPDKTEAAARLPLGLADKLFLSLADPEVLPADTHMLGSASRGATGTYQLRPFGASVVEAYFAGDLAHDLERAGAEAALSFAADELAAQFGTDIRKQLSVVAMSAWAATPQIGGSYSYAEPGASDRRGVLAEPHDERIFFAGEACSRSRYSTAHGAYESGVVAADRIARSLPRDR